MPPSTHSQPAKLSVHPDGYLVTEAGHPFFYFTDTAWMAIPNLSIADWARYLVYRRLQGFTALQISILPVTHDTSMGPENIDPFLPGADGNWGTDAYNEAYFVKAETMVEMAVAQGFVPVLGVIWCSYVPDTRCSQGSPVASAMPFAAVKPFAAFVARPLQALRPHLLHQRRHTLRITPGRDLPYYMAALQCGERSLPGSTPFPCICIPQGDLPRTFIEAVDFYMYQSGHGAASQHQPYTFAEKFCAYPVKRQIVNSEPPYEGHGRIGKRTRFDAFDVRKATWQSLLSGAKMGVTYGAHGVWSFHQQGMNFLNAHRSFEPFDWDEALYMDGAWDVAFAKHLFETYNLFAANPVALRAQRGSGVPRRRYEGAEHYREYTALMHSSSNSTLT